MNLNKKKNLNKKRNLNKKSIFKSINPVFDTVISIGDSRMSEMNKIYELDMDSR